MTPRPVRFAILGFGHHAVRRLLPAFLRCREATLVGMWRRDTTAAAINCREHAIPHCFPTREALCESAEVDVVFVTSPDAMHRDDVLLALQCGKAVLCEKPLAMDAGEAREMAEAAKTAGMLYGAGQNFRFNRSLEWIREQIAKGSIGSPQVAHLQYAYPAAKAPRRWIADPTLACGGPIADVGVHLIDALRYVLGEEVRTVSTLARKQDPSAKVESVASLQMEMTGGAFANVTVSAHAPYRTLVEMEGSEGVLIAENGLSVDGPVELVWRRGGTVVETATIDNGDAYVRMLESFALASRGLGTFPASGEDGIENMRALDAAYRSSRTGLREAV